MGLNLDLLQWSLEHFYQQFSPDQFKRIDAKLIATLYRYDRYLWKANTNKILNREITWNNTKTKGCRIRQIWGQFLTIIQQMCDLRQLT